MTTPSASRNDPCPCGSGKRYKACHGALASVDTAPVPDAAAADQYADGLFDRGDFAGAAHAYERLRAQRGLSAESLVRFGAALEKSGRLADAEARYREAAARAPDHAEIFSNIGSVCVLQQRFADADQPLMRALELDPRDAYSLAMLAHARQQCCAWDGIDRLFGALRRMLEGTSELRWPIVPFPLLAMPLSPRHLLAAARRWSRSLAPSPPISRPAWHARPGERLRVGFVSSDFRPHPLVVVLTELWERLDRNRIETFAYGLLPEDNSEVGSRVNRAFEHFADVSRSSDVAIVQRVRDDRIDILFDLNGYTTHARSEIFAMRPAPLQINYIGYPGTLGAEWYDYIIVDRFIAPLTMQPHFTERFLHMPHAHYPSDTTRAPNGTPPPRAQLGLPDEGFVFCNFNASYKILPDVFAIWMRLLHAVPGSVLWLLDTNDSAKANLPRAVQRAGIAPERLRLATPVSPVDHVARNAAADLFLDTFPYGGHTTTNDALLAGLPVLTCAGDTLVSRIAGSQLRAVGLPELVARNLADYEARALRLARNPKELSAIRARLAVNRRTQPLFDMARYARDFEDRLLQIAHERAQGQRG
ncbi:MAG TPA: SEC-C metal-binding domain-containing protein [Casimicrobiaceae bacterium]|nr:SEC-C metal-binding domain-containing protein [Casimicrobiaceae bacterium]